MINAILVIVNTPSSVFTPEYFEEEMKNLCSSSNINISYTIVQNLKSANSKYYTGVGKLEEIMYQAKANECDTIIYDDELSPAQLKNITEYFKDYNILDRSQIILNIFTKRANSNEAILQVKLAKARYDLPRIGLLTGYQSREGASGSGLHSKGSGETSQELSKRHLAHMISNYINELNEIKKRKTLASQKRKQNSVPIVALVGYTNAGKSTTMNKIIEYCNGDSNKSVYAKDELFATLDTRIRQIEYNHTKFLLVDTVGFVSKLPNSLFEAFRTTLEEIKSADLIINVLDFSSQFFNEQYNITLNMLNNIDCLNKKQLLLLNKYDLLEDQNIMIQGLESMPYSNYTGLNIDKLLEYIKEQIGDYEINLRLNIPYKEQKLCHIIEENATINSKLYLSEYIYYDIIISKKYYKDLSLFEINENIN